MKWLKLGILVGLAGCGLSDDALNDAEIKHRCNGADLSWCVEEFRTGGHMDIRTDGTFARRNIEYHQNLHARWMRRDVLSHEQFDRWCEITGAK